jgi:hypothetical protein
VLVVSFSLEILIDQFENLLISAKSYLYEGCKEYHKKLWLFPHLPIFHPKKFQSNRTIKYQIGKLSDHPKIFIFWNWSHKGFE